MAVNLLVTASIPLADLASRFKLTLAEIDPNCLRISATIGLRFVGPLRLICAVKLKALAINFVPYRKIKSP